MKETLHEKRHENAMFENRKEFENEVKCYLNYFLGTFIHKLNTLYRIRNLWIN